MHFVASLILSVLFFGASVASAQQESITGIKVRGNSKVEPDAIITMLENRVGDTLDAKRVQRDIRKLYELGYFSEVKFLKESSSAGVEIIIEVVEKPAIVSIEFEGFESVTQEDLKDKLDTKLYTIVNEASINSDLRVIEKQYAEKGFYLASATYKLESKSPSEVALKYVATEGEKVRIGEVHILGNEFFKDAELIDKLMTRPLTRGSSFSSVGSMYNDDFVNRDLEFLSLFYRDYGFAKIKVAKPIIQLESDRQFANVTFQVEEGQQYNVSSIDVVGDLLFPKEELLEAMKLKPGELFRYSRFRADIEMLIDKYGDLGYAFVDVDPRTPFDDDKKTVALTYNITKGDKVYFGKLNITGNGKTRDNVIRRELEIADTELYSGTRLRASKSNIERLGFFEEVQSIKSRDPNNPQVLDYQFKVKEKATGQLQAALGFQPGSAQSDQTWFGQGRYNEENQSGKGWKTNVTGKWNGSRTYDLSIGFTDPRLDDGPWSLGFTVFKNVSVMRVTEAVEVLDDRIGGSATLGRSLFELVRGSMTYKISNITQTTDSFLLSRLKEGGLSSSVVLGLRRNSTNNYIDPTEGSDLGISQTFTGGEILRGDHQFMETSFNASYYFPIDFTDTYRTYFRLHNTTAHIYPMAGKPIPLFERYKLGGPNNLRGYDLGEIGPQFNILQSPNGTVSRYIKGGDKQIFFQIEYFMPLIPEAGIKLLTFADAGNVFDDSEELNLGRLKRDFGFGFRWITPVAPFRFEWAYPYENGKVGDLQFIFYLGY